MTVCCLGAPFRTGIPAHAAGAATLASPCAGKAYEVFLAVGFKKGENGQSASQVQQFNVRSRRGDIAFPDWGRWMRTAVSSRMRFPVIPAWDSSID